MANWHNEDTDRLCAAILSLRTVDECYAFLDDICTIRELEDLAMRLKVAGLLHAGRNYQSIGQETRVSSATISRVRRCLAHGNSGYQTVLSRLDAQEGADHAAD